MLNRIWGRTQVRSTTQQASSHHYSPFGDMNEFTPLSSLDQSHLRLTDPSQNSLITVLGNLLIQGRKVRIHWPKGEIQTPAFQFAAQWPNPKPYKRSEHEKSTEQFELQLNSWETGVAEWQKSLQSLQSITFSSLNSLEVFQSVIQSLPTANMALFQRVDTSGFQWSEDEYRLIETHLNQARQYGASAAKSWIIQQWHLYPPAFQDDSPTLVRDIKQMILEIEEVHTAMHQLGRQLERHLRAKEEFPDWHGIQQAINRSTLLTLPNHDSIREQQVRLEESIKAATKSLRNKGWFSNWNGFQFISLDEMEQEILTIRQRLVRLKQYLPEILEGLSYQEWSMGLPVQAKHILKSLSPQQLDSAYNSFPCWYLARWLEKKTPGSDWTTLMNQSALTAQAEHLQLLSLDLLAYGQGGQSIDNLMCWVNEENELTGSIDHDDQQIDIYWRCSPAQGVAFCDIHRIDTLPIGPELNRIIYLMDHLDASTRMDLPAPMHLKPNFWHPDQVKFNPALSIQLESTMVLSD